MQIVTPADLRAMRITLGMSRRELGLLLDLHEDDVRQFERMRSDYVYEGHFHLLDNLLQGVNNLLELQLSRYMGRPGPPYIFTFPNDGAFADYEPSLAAWMKFNSVHWAYSCRLLDEFMKRGEEVTRIIEIIPAQYLEHLKLHDERDSWSQRIGWADAHMASVNKMLAGNPPRRPKHKAA